MKSPREASGLHDDAARDAGEPDEQLHARVAWLYHKEDRTQAEIAAMLGLTRLRVNRVLAECRARGIVQVTLNVRLADCVALERALVERFGLADAVIVPTPRDAERIPELVGQAAGEFLAAHLRRHGITRLGIGWGATLREAIRSMPLLDRPDASVTSLMGGLTRGSELNTFEIASELARRLGASCFYLAAPIYAGSRRSRDTILAQDVFTEMTERMRAVEIAFLSLGDLSPRSLLIRHGLPADVAPAELAAAGAVGDVLGQFIDAEGARIAHALNDRAVGLSLEELRRIPAVILAAGGTHKAPVIAAALRGGLGRVLISDEAAANAVLALARPDARARARGGMA